MGLMKSRTYLFLSLLAIVIIIAVYLLKPVFYQSVVSSDLAPEQVKELMGAVGGQPSYTELPSPYTHELYDSELYFTGSALIDVDGDGVDEVFVGGQKGDALLFFQGDHFENRAEAWGLGETDGPGLGSLSLDFDNDGDVDLLVARPADVFYYENTGTTFIKKPLGVSVETTTMPFGLTATDSNGDGLPDLFISTFIHPDAFRLATFNDPTHVGINRFLLNKGGGEFVDITEESGIDFKQNTFLSTFVDLDGDGLQDFVSAPNTDTVKIYRNLGGMKFKALPPQTGFGFWMGLAVGDYDNDGDPDLFFTNTGNTVPESVVRGDLNSEQEIDLKWALLRNDGNFAFTRANDEAGIANFEFAWGAQFADLNLDGREDLIVAQNYKKWPAHRFVKLKGRLLVQGTDGRYLPAGEALGIENPYYGMTPLVTDFNADGMLDLVYINIDGPTRIYLSDGRANNTLFVRLPDDVRSLGAKLVLHKNDGSTMSRWITAGTGLLSDQSAQAVFGLGSDETASKLEVFWPSGKQTVIAEPQLNTVLMLREE
ncbi:hypothetical protein CO046_01640 [Candidatus Peregrinibacteria bacterium CG_4_9_14_0_2_um_filter_53_11]|nr:MAG: hypothetical protein CO046_01640 [Candidatus Peregrinibacteria bacterium CG_4_9_14_0_2_um_filter_53_11]